MRERGAHLDSETHSRYDFRPRQPSRRNIYRPPQHLFSLLPPLLTLSLPLDLSNPIALQHRPNNIKSAHQNLLPLFAFRVPFGQRDYTFEDRKLERGVGGEERGECFGGFTDLFGRSAWRER